MIITLSENKVSQLIKNLEGIEDDVEEIVERMSHYAARLFKHVLEAYRLRFVGLTAQRGKIADFRFAIETSDLETIVAGLRFLNPVAISVEKTDMPRLVPDKIIGSTVASAWPEYSARLQKITPGELSPIIEDLAWKTVGGRLGVTNQPDTFEGWLQQHGLKDPAANYRKVEEQEAAADTREKARQQALYDTWING